MMNTHGFTLVEILTAVIIVAILTVMAMPLYEKTIERSRLAEARTLMNRLQEAKLAAMDNMDCDTYDPTSSKCPKLQHLGVTFAPSASGTTFQTKDFTYSLGATGDTFPNGICAKRNGGDNKDTVFAYYGLRQDGYEAEFKCKNATNCSECCSNYGLDDTSTLKCTF